jgi:hypothetical protein
MIGFLVLHVAEEKSEAHHDTGVKIFLVDGRDEERRRKFPDGHVCEI